MALYIMSVLLDEFSLQLKYSAWNHALLIFLQCKYRCLSRPTIRNRKVERRTLFAFIHYTTTTTTVLLPFIRDHPGEPVPEENCWTLWRMGRLTESNTPIIRLGTTPSGLTSAHLHHPPIFYRPDALPAAQPTASKH